MPIHNNEAVMNARRKARRERQREYRQRERMREINMYADIAYHRIIGGNYRNERIYSYTEFIKVKFPVIYKEIIKVLFKDKDFVRVENHRIYNLLRVRDLIPEDKIEEVLEYQEFLNYL